MKVIVIKEEDRTVVECPFCREIHEICTDSEAFLKRMEERFSQRHALCSQKESKAPQIQQGTLFPVEVKVSGKRGSKKGGRR
jgi:hypothetical protein